MVRIQGLEGLHGFNCPVEAFHALAPGDHHRSREGERVVQALGRRHFAALQNISVAHRFHSQHTDASLHQLREDLVPEASKVCVHYIEGHLTGVEVERVRRRDLQHSQMYNWIFVTGESNVADLPGLFRFQQCFQWPVGGEKPVRIFHADIFVILHEVDSFCLEAFQGLLDLSRRSRFGPAVKFRHQEDLLAITVTKRFSHAALAFAVVIIPTVVHERNTAVDRAADNPDSFLGILWPSNVMTAQTNG